MSRPGPRHCRPRVELLERRLVLSHCGPFDLGDGLGPKFIGDGVTTFIEDFSDNPNHEDWSTVPAGVDRCEAQGERLFTHNPSQPNLVPGDSLDLPPRNRTYVLAVGRFDTHEIQFRGIHPDYEVAAVGVDVESDGFGPVRIEFVGAQGTIVEEGTGGFFAGHHVATRGSIIPGTQTELGSIQSIRFTNLGAFQAAFDNVTLLVAPREVNDAPIAWDDDAFVLPSTDSEPTRVRINVLANDDDPEGRSLSLASVTAPANGTATIDGETIIYSPDTNFHGRDEFEYTVRDDEGLTSTATVRVSVNTPPTASPNSYPIAHGTTGQIAIGNPGLLEHAFDADGDVLSAFLVDPPQHGTLSVQLGGGFIYTPTTPDGRVLPDVFSYRVFDGFQTSNVAQVGIHVPNQPPVAGDVDLAGFLRHSDLVNRNVISRPLNVSDPEGDPLSVQIVGDPAFGTVALSESAPLTFEYRVTGGDMTNRGIASDSFTYQAVDAYGAVSNVGTVFLLWPNSEPIAVDNVGDHCDDNDACGFHFSRNRLLDNRYEVSPPGFLGDDIDLDGDALFLHSIVTPPTQGTLTVDFADGGFVYEPFDLRNEVRDSFSYIATDGFAKSNVATVDIRVSRNQPPRSGDLTYRTPAGSALIRDASAGLLSDAQDREGDPFMLELVSGPHFGQLAFSEDGAFTYTPDTGFVGNDQIVIFLNDPLQFSPSPLSLFGVRIAVFSPEDADADGVSDAEEVAAITAFDGNDSRIAEFTDPGFPSSNSRVALFSPVNGQALTLSCDCDFSNVSLVSNPPAAGLPAEYVFPFGFFKFAATPLRGDGLLNVTLSLPDGFHVDSYWKNGSTSDNPSPHWYDFTAEDTFTVGAHFKTDDDSDPDTDRIFLRFLDGQLGDDDRTVNGLIIDPGGPALLAPAIETVAIDGSALAVRGQPLEFAFMVEPPGTYRYEIDWDGDGTIDEAHEASESLGLTHVYPQAGNFQVVATVSTQGGAAATSATHDVAVTAVALVDGKLLVGGTESSDKIDFTRHNQGQPPQVLVKIGKTKFGPFPLSDVHEVVAFGQAGNDKIVLASSLQIPARFFGGEGNDLLIGGKLNDILVGGGGNDIAISGRGRDMLVGGADRDLLVGGSQGDLVIGGTTLFDDRQAALRAILNEWSSERPLAVRIANLTDGNGSPDRQNGDVFLNKDETVVDDHVLDWLLGQQGDDWLFAFGDLALGGGAKDRVVR